ncbi:protein-export chaperone SecB [Sporosarcina sp. P16b]|uniref:protein-export chaperone SecB n=1 Tax=Sporosarcina sp. P16b TaxID=2048261 RepID=UPI0018EA85CA|nr:protein-export chaperone SecB [Sporosarcina sp. P16b]
MNEYMEFKGFSIKKLNYEIKNEKNQSGKKDTSVKFNIGYGVSEEIEELKKGHLLVSCYIDQFRENSKMEIEVTLEGMFDFPSNSTEEIEQFIKLNGTTILMPYVRNIVSMVSGYDSTKNHFLLPTINVQKLFQNEEF